MQHGSLAGPFGPVVDGDILPSTPEEIRQSKNFLPVQILAGVTKDEGAYIVRK